MKKQLFFMAIIVTMAVSCKKNDIPNITIPPSAGSTLQLLGLIGQEPGSAAGNSVFVDLSADKQYPVARSSWDLGFYCGNEFRVIINNTTSATAFVTSKTELSQVTAADTVGKGLIFNPFEPSAANFAKMDDVDGSLSKCVIPAIDAKDGNNKVVIINPGTGGSAPARSFIKVKINRSGSNGYSIQYANLNESTSKTATIEKDSKYNFKYLSVEKGAQNAEPEKSDWDIVWTFSMYKTSMGPAGFVPYAFSDLVGINYLNQTTAVERTYTDESTAAAAFTAFNKDSAAKYTLATDRWTIGSKWRRTAQPGSSVPAGTYKNKFYVIKDSKGNMYKLKFVSFTSEDGGTRGKPEIKYELIK